MSHHAYAMLISSQFQGFCRDFHSECVDYAVVNGGTFKRIVVLP